MTGHEKFFQEGDLVHTMASPTERPDLLIPMKATVLETQHHQEDPFYRVRAITFYDDLEFLRRTIGSLRFKSKLDRNIPIPFKVDQNFSSMQKLIDELNYINAAFIVRDSMTTETKKELMELYTRIEDYLIAKMIREWKERSERTAYEGTFKVGKDGEWYKRFRDAMYDRLKENTNNPDQIIEDLCKKPENPFKHQKST